MIKQDVLICQAQNTLLFENTILSMHHMEKCLLASDSSLRQNLNMHVKVTAKHKANESVISILCTLKQNCEHCIFAFSYIKPNLLNLRFFILKAESIPVHIFSVICTYVSVEHGLQKISSLIFLTTKVILNISCKFFIASSSQVCLFTK